MHPYHHLAEGGVFELTQVGEEASPWTETVDALTTAEHVLTKMTEAISGDGAAVAPGQHAHGHVLSTTMVLFPILIYDNFPIG